MSWYKKAQVSLNPQLVYKGNKMKKASDKNEKLSKTLGQIKLTKADVIKFLKKETQVIPDDGIADGGEPYTEEEMAHINEESEEVKWVSYSFGATPEDVIKERIRKQTPNGYSMTIKNQGTWTAIFNAVNQGIDAHLEGFTRSKFDNGKVNIHPEEMTTLLRRLYEDGSEEAWSLRTDILSTLNIEEI